MFGAIVQYPAGEGEVYNYKDYAAKAHEKGIKLTVVADLMSLVLLNPSRVSGVADIVVGNSQRFRRTNGFRRPACGIFCY